jgi:anti-sigma regulatory factor (Ser/Thr protein kinase)
LVDTSNGRGIRGIGEPVWPGRSSAEVVECHRHEALLNLAFAGTTAFWLVCPYDTTSLDPEVIDRAIGNHPLLRSNGAAHPNDAYRGADGHFDDPLPGPPTTMREHEITLRTLAELRGFVSSHARAMGLDPDRAKDLTLAVNELATNSLRYSPGRASLRSWSDETHIVHEVRDLGYIDQPLVGRVKPSPRQLYGRGLWIVNQICDLVQVRSSPQGTVVRVHVRR